MKIVLQHDERDCGAACLAMVAAHFGAKYPLQYFRELTKTDRNGANLFGLVDAAAQIGFSADSLSGDIDELVKGILSGEVPLPAVAHIITPEGMQHFVVIFSFRRGKLLIGDPGSGKKQLTIEQFASLWTGYLVTFQLTERFQKVNLTKGGFVKFFRLLAGQQRNIAAILILSLFIAGIGIAGSYVFEVVLDDFYYTSLTPASDVPTAVYTPAPDNASTNNPILDFISNNASKFNLFFVLLIILYVLQGGIQFARGYLISVLSKRIDIKLMIPYYDKLIALPVSTLNTRSTGEYMARFSDAANIRTAVSGATLTIVLDSLMVAASAVILAKENGKLFIVSFIMIVIYAIVVALYRKPLSNSNRDVMEKNASVQSYLKESIDGAEILKANNAESAAKQKHEHKFSSFIHSVFRLNLLDSSQDAICSSVELCGIAVILWLGFAMVINGAIGVGSLMTFYALLGYFTAPIKNLIELQPMIQTAMIAADRLNDVLDAKKEDEDNDSDVMVEQIHTVRFSHVDFRYGNRELTLSDISFHINRGEKIAIVGESGSGKTTIAKLLMKYYSPESGTISINENDISNLQCRTVRKRIAYIAQDTFLFSDSVNNNLTLGSTDITEDQINRICELTGTDQLIRNLPFGLDTVLEENGQNLSGGQRQRLAIVRALLKNPDLLILDEATSNLDAITENSIQNAIFDQHQNLTCLFIAHKLSTIKKCDRIYVLHEGKIIESGTYEELENSNSIFSAYLSVQ